MSLNKFTDINQEKSWMNINCNQLKCKNFEFDIDTGIKNVLTRKYFTRTVQEINPSSNEVNILTGATTIGDTSYNGDDVSGSHYRIETLMRCDFDSGDIIIYRLKRGGKTILTFSQAYGSDPAIQNLSVKLNITITCTTVGPSGSLNIDFELVSGDSSNGVTTQNGRRYLMNIVPDDTSETGDLQLTIEPSNWSLTSQMRVKQSLVTQMR